MMCLSQTTGYAVQALGCMNDPLRPVRHLSEIAKCAGLPKAYLAKIISALSRKNLVITKRGTGGGIYLTRSPKEISLLDIVEAVEGEHWLGECLLGFSDCKKHFTCPTQHFWDGFKQQITDALRQTNLADILSATGQQTNQPAKPSRHKTVREEGEAKWRKKGN